MEGSWLDCVRVGVIKGLAVCCSGSFTDQMEASQSRRIWRSLAKNASMLLVTAAQYHASGREVLSTPRSQFKVAVDGSTQRRTSQLTAFVEVILDGFIGQSDTSFGRRRCHEYRSTREGYMTCEYPTCTRNVRCEITSCNNWRRKVCACNNGLDNPEHW
jgi:hypothetical protein